MRFMHTRLPDFIKKLIDAGKTNNKDIPVSITGLEQFKSAKLASASCGMIEEDIYNLTKLDDIEKVEIKVMPQLPLALYTVIINGVDKDGNILRTYLETEYISEPGPEFYYHNSKEVIDHRVKLIQPKD